MGKSTISMAIFNSYVSLPEGNQHVSQIWSIKLGIHEDLTMKNRDLTNLTNGEWRSICFPHKEWDLGKVWAQKSRGPCVWQVSKDVEITL